jgi:serine/threonine protein kinase
MPREGRLVGKKIDRYRFQQLVGRGSSGEVYRAHDVRLRRDVAIKAFDPDLVRDPNIFERFLKEARIQARLEHSNIVPIYDLLEHRRRLCLVMRFVRGENLRRVIEQRRAPLDPREAIDLLRQVLEGVGFAHSKGVIHQDLKPHNIQVTPAGEALLVDFGVACLVGERKEGRSKAIGTPAYMSPEQVEGRYVDSRTDIYSLGMSLYQLVTAHHPFEDAQDLDQILGWQSSREPLPPSYFVPTMPRGLERAIMQAVSKSARDRFRNCREFAEALGVALEQDAAGGDPEDVRWDPRADIVVPARVRIAGGSDFQPARTVDLSAGGAAMRMRQPPPPSTPIVVEIYLPAAAENEPSVVSADAVIVWVSGEKGRDTVGAGVRFTKLSDMDRERIGAVVREALVLGGESSLFGSTTPQAL